MAEPIPLKHTISLRFAATLTSNVLRLALAFLSGIFIARAMGPANYGNLNFLLATFASALPLMEMGTSSAFYTFIAQRKRGTAFYATYTLWLALQLILPGICIGLLFPSSWIHTIWVANSRSVVLLALISSFAGNQLWRAIQQIGESARETIFTQKLRLYIAIMHFLFVLAAMYGSFMTINAVLWAVMIEYILMTVYFIRYFNWHDVWERTDNPAHGEIVSSYYSYCAPLAISGWLGFIYQFADRWLLQHFGGAAQQGFFSVGEQFSAISLLCATSLVNIFWKEIASAHAAGDMAKQERLYNKSSKSLYFASCATACLLIPFADMVLNSLLGKKYAAAGISLSLMLFFPVHQSLGQINGAYLLATGRTMLSLIVSLASVIISLPVSYLTLASPQSFVPGLGLGASGLALKSVVVQALLVNLQGYLICRINSWKYHFWYQIFVPVVLLSFGYFCYFLMPVGNGVVRLCVDLLLATVLFVLLAGWFLYRLPEVVGLEREKLDYWIAIAKEKIKALRTDRA
jgi:O-antigen/teichoic acid export membrane protein